MCIFRCFSWTRLLAGVVRNYLPLLPAAYARVQPNIAFHPLMVFIDQSREGAVAALGRHPVVEHCVAVIGWVGEPIQAE